VLLSKKTAIPFPKELPCNRGTKFYHPVTQVNSGQVEWWHFSSQAASGRKSLPAAILKSGLAESKQLPTRFSIFFDFAAFTHFQLSSNR
jgi:hypothetical protein